MKEIQMAQIIAGEEAVVKRLIEKGLIPNNPIVNDVIVLQLTKEEFEYVKRAVRYTECISSKEDSVKELLLIKLSKTQTQEQ